jgi:hypothetical protein
MSNNLKRAIRARMETTGERYTTARMHVLAGAPTPVAPAAAVPRSAHAPGEEHPGGSRGGR